MCGKWSALKGASHLIAVDNDAWRLQNFKDKIHKDHPDLKIDTVNFDEVSNVPERIHDLTRPGEGGRNATRPPGLDIGLECAAGEYAKSWRHKLLIQTGLETDTPELLNELMCVLFRPFCTFCRSPSLLPALPPSVSEASVSPESTPTLPTASTSVPSCSVVSGSSSSPLYAQDLADLFHSSLIGNGQAPCHKYMQHIMDKYIVTGVVKPRELFITHRCVFSCFWGLSAFFPDFFDFSAPIEDTAIIYTKMREHDPKDNIVHPLS
jgi:threonine dehydrogenase-like Zn-dependent dehydrogenase